MVRVRKPSGYINETKDMEKDRHMNTRHWNLRQPILITNVAEQFTTNAPNKASMAAI